jgi:hypothetical protein
MSITGEKIMNEEFYQNFLNQLKLIDSNFYWDRELDIEGQWLGTYRWGLKNRNYSKGRFKTFEGIVDSVSRHILILPTQK